MGRFPQAVDETAAPTSAVLEIALLGPLRIARDGQQLTLSGPKRRALLTLLALHAGTPLHRDRIVDALWPQRRTGREESTLRVHVSHLRDVLEPARDTEPHIIVTVGSAYVLDERRVELDLLRFQQLAQQAGALLPDEADRALPLLNEALGLWRGRPLHDVEYEEFAQQDIRRLELARIEAVQDRAEALIELGEDAAAIEDLEALVRTDATRERPVRLLMRALYQAGRQADALRAARRHTRELAEQGLDPSPAVDDLRARILRHDPALRPAGTVSPGDIRPGRSVRGYELREEVGAGSIGIVYRAFQASVGREVAIKAIRPEFATAPDFVRRFADEARIVASLAHPHIVPLHDFWRDPTGAFLVMRWMEGSSLEQRLERPWDEHELGRVFGQLADALGYAHAAGVVHRDVKPANVLFDASGNAYLGDFGLAVTRTDAGAAEAARSTIQPPYASPELLRGEPPSVASDVFGLGVLLSEAASGRRHPDPGAGLAASVAEVVRVATAPAPADRYPDMAAFGLALRDALGPTTLPMPRRVLRNPYKGLAPFGEGDRADFYGRDDVVETLVGLVGDHGLVAVVGASGSGKSSVIKAGLLPELRDGALPGSEEWAIVEMVPGTDPFEEFHLGLRATAVAHPVTPSDHDGRELRHAFAAALDGPASRALLIVDQFEEVFSSQVDGATRERFLDNLIDLATDPSRHVRVVLTLRADFSDRALAHPRFGELVSAGSLLLPPMRPEQVEEAIRRPAARVGMQVEPGLVAEVVRDVVAAPASLPLLQYVLSELFEQRTDDRLTVQAYRALGGVQGVLERRAEATFTALDPDAQRAARQLFLRLVHVGDHGEETRRRLPLTELHGLGRRAAVDAALDAFSAARLLTYDRDPVTRTPTIEVAHETVIRRWTRYRVWVDETRADLLAHRRLAAAAEAWTASDEDPSFLLTGGPLSEALDVTSAGRVRLNALEHRFVTESRRADEAARQHEADRARQETLLRQRARRRLELGLVATLVATLVAVVAAFAWIERQRANDLAATQERQNIARELAAVSAANLQSDPELSLLLALEAADRNLAAGEEVLPEVVDALHRAVITPKPDLDIPGARGDARGRVLTYSRDGTWLVVLADDGGAMVLDPLTGEEIGRLPPMDPPAVGVDVHPDGQRVLTVHADAVRQWDWRSQELETEWAAHPDGVEVTTAAYARDGSAIAIGRDDGVIDVWRGSEHVELRGHAGQVGSVDFDPSGTRLVSSSSEPDPTTGYSALVWDLGSGTVTVSARMDTVILPIVQAAWHPAEDVVAVATHQGENLLFDAGTGERLNSFGNGQHHHEAIAFDSTGTFVVGAGRDGFTRVFGTWVGGEAAIVLPTGGVPVRDAAFDPADPSLTIATIGVGGRVKIWRDLVGSELPVRPTRVLYPEIVATPDGSRYVVAAHGLRFGVEGADPTMDVIDAATGRALLSRPTLAGWGARHPAIAPDGSLVAFAGPDGDVEIVDVETGATTSVPGSARWTATLAFSRDGTRLAGGGVDGSIVIWDVATGDTVQTLRGHGDRSPRIRTAAVDPPPDQGLDIALSIPGASVSRVDQVAFRPGSSELASAGFDGTVRAWNPASGDGRILHEFDHEVFAVAYAPDGASVAAADRSGTVLLLDADSGDVVRSLDPVPGPVDLVFSPDGRHLAGAGPGSVTHLWELATGRIVRRLEGAIYPATSAAFVNGGAELRVASGEGVVRGYLLDPTELVELAREQVTRDLTEAECQQYLRHACDAVPAG